MNEITYPAVEEEIYVPDTSVVIEGAVSKLIEDGIIKGKVIAVSYTHLTLPTKRIV